MWGFDPTIILAAAAIGAVAGFVKGAVGFAMPMIMISGLASLLPGELALAIIILPTLASNALQAVRDGLLAARASAWRFRRYIGVVIVAIFFSAQLVRILPQSALFLILGGFVTLFAALQLSGWRIHVPPGARARTEWIVGLIAGGFGGLSGVWGPPTVMYLTAIEVAKRESVRVQGVVYCLGSIALLLAHLRSGVLNGETAPLSAAMLLPAGLGMAAGLAVQDRLDQARFRRLTLIVLTLAGLNLIRRALV
jgi:uncharacterized membrane protein YfcA